MSFVKLIPKDIDKLKNILIETISKSDKMIGKKTIIELFEQQFDTNCFLAYEHQNKYRNVTSPFQSTRKIANQEINKTTNKLTNTDLTGYLKTVYWSSEGLDFVVKLVINSRLYFMVVTQMRGNRSRMSLKNGTNNMESLDINNEDNTITFQVTNNIINSY